VVDAKKYHIDRYAEQTNDSWGIYSKEYQSEKWKVKSGIGLSLKCKADPTWSFPLFTLFDIRLRVNVQFRSGRTLCAPTFRQSESYRVTKLFQLSTLNFQLLQKLSAFFCIDKPAIILYTDSMITERSL
jgi:hypothetical protein